MDAERASRRTVAQACSTANPVQLRVWERTAFIIRSPSWVEAQVMEMRVAKFSLGQVVRHRVFPFRGVIFDVDAEFSNSEEWWSAIPEHSRPRRDQPFYHLFAENAESCYVAYVSEQNLVPDDSGEPVAHPSAAQMFAGFQDGAYRTRLEAAH